MFKRHTAVLAGLLLAAPVAAAPYLVRDLNRGPAGPSEVDPRAGVVLAGVFYFPGADPAHGTELWRSDGTAAGTYRVTDVCAGSCSSSPTALQVWNGEVYFSADDGFSGRELWASDGVPGHERRIKDVCAGPCASSPASLAPAGSRLLFLATLGQRQQLWVTNGVTDGATDGTAAGTVRLATFCLGSVGCIPASGLRSTGDQVFFAVRSGQSQEVWRSDGTAAGTYPLQAVASNAPPNVSDVIAAPGLAYYWSAEGLWRSDGTAAGTFEVVSTAAVGLAADDLPARTAVAGGLVYTTFSNGELVRSDGTAAGTFVVARTFRPEASIDILVPFAGGLLYVSEGTDFSPSELWVTRGTPESTVELVSFANLGFIDEIVGAGERAFFAEVDEVGSQVLGFYVTDGTPAGTVSLSAAVPALAEPGAPGAAGDAAFFLSRAPGASVRDVLWVTDGTAQATRAVRDFGAGPGSSGPLEQIAFRGQLLFSARTSATMAPLFLSDGTAAGTRQLSADAAFGTGFTPFGSRVFFGARPGDLWATDGTAAGTVRIAPAPGFSAPKVLGSRLLFTAAAETSFFGAADFELWKSDGTARGTGVVREIDPFQDDVGDGHVCVGESSSPGLGVLAGGRLLFPADDGVHGREVWASDGTSRGTRLVLDINPLRVGQPQPSDCGPTRPDTGLGSNPDDFVHTASGALALFAADDGVHGRELWRSDGTAAGTRLLADLRPGLSGSAPHDLTRLGNEIYFFASVYGPGEALFRTNGTAAGTSLVADLSLAGKPSWGRSLTVSGGRLFFVAYNETTGAELWTSQGDAASTHLVEDLNPGPASAAPQQLADAGGVLAFAADDGKSGLEPWRSDGTATGTRRLGDLAPGRAASSPGPFTVAAGRLLFGADDGVHGRELWAIPLDEVLTP
jgi:ELWxxDGT repeat protein